MTEPLKHPHLLALEQRNFEITLFWQRSNYFLLLNTGLLIAFFTNVLKEQAILLSLFGVAAAILWVLTNLGSKFWQERWEIAVSETEPRENQVKLFSEGTIELKQKVRKRLKEQQPPKHPFYIWLVTLKPSVSFLMILLSSIFLFAWTLIFGFELYKFCTCSAVRV
mgnify:CR=1 FL=1